MKKAVVCGAGGFIGSHLVRKLKDEGFWVKGIDIKNPDFSPSVADKFVVGDLRDPSLCLAEIETDYDELYQLAADMGGAGYLFTGTNDADIMHNSCLVNLNVLRACEKAKVKKIFYSSSACVYPEGNQENPDAPVTAEGTVYPANPDSEYGWEKLFSERMYLAFRRNHNMDCRVGRFHNIYGPEGTWRGGKEKVPAAMCRKVAEAGPGDTIEVWGDGEQSRTFLYVEECLNGVRRLMDSEDFVGPVNIGSDELVTINELVAMVMQIAGKDVNIKHIPGPTGVRGRTSDNTLIQEKLGWSPNYPLKDGLNTTYHWIKGQIEKG